MFPGPLSPNYDRKRGESNAKTERHREYLPPERKCRLVGEVLPARQALPGEHTQDERKGSTRLLKQRLGEIVTGNFYGPKSERVRIDELAGDLLRDYRINGKRSLDDLETRWKLHLKPYFGDLKAIDVSSDLVAQYVDKRQEQKAKNATINRELAALKRMFHLGHRTTPPKVNRIPAFPRLAENNIRKGFLEDGQYEKLFGSCSENWFRAIVEVGRTYGWRVGELLNMRVKQIDLLSRTIRVLKKRPCHSGKAYEQGGRVTCCDKAHFPTYPLGLPTPVQGSQLVEAMYPS
jgi:hypothetical protein